MNIGQFVLRSGTTVKWLAEKTGFTEAYVRLILRGKRKPSPRAFERFYWATRGAITAEACGLDPKAVDVPPLNQLIHPFYPGTSWPTHCEPELKRLRGEGVAEGGPVNP